MLVWPRCRRWNCRALRELHLRGNPFTAVPEVGALAALAAGARPAREPAHERARTGSVELPDLQKLDLRWNEVYALPVRLPDGCVVLTE